jgi:hypothetical protein
MMQCALNNLYADGWVCKAGSKNNFELQSILDLVEELLGLPFHIIRGIRGA